MTVNRLVTRTYVDSASTVVVMNVENMTCIVKEDVPTVTRRTGRCGELPSCWLCCIRICGCNLPTDIVGTLANEFTTCFHLANRIPTSCCCWRSSCPRCSIGGIGDCPTDGGNDVTRTLQIKERADVLNNFLLSCARNRNRG